jgi:hypothetical protein
MAPGAKSTGILLQSRDINPVFYRNAGTTITFFPAKSRKCRILASMPIYGIGVCAERKLHLSACGGERVNSGIHAARSREEKTSLTYSTFLTSRLKI